MPVLIGCIQACFPVTSLPVTCDNFVLYATLYDGRVPIRAIVLQTMFMRGLFLSPLSLMVHNILVPL